MNIDLTNKNALIGGSSKGIGLAIAQRRQVLEQMLHSWQEMNPH